MTGTGTPPVAAPRPEVVAAQDQVTSTLMRVWHLRYRFGATPRTFALSTGAFLLLGALQALLAGPTSATYAVYFIVFALGFQAWYWFPGSSLRWAHPALGLLRAQPWRVVPARVLRGGRWSAVVEVVDRVPVELSVWIDPAHLAMITDTAYLVRHGEQAVLRVPGSRAMFLARARGPVAAVEVPAVRVTERWARVLRERILLLPVQGALLVGALLLGVWLTDPPARLVVAMAGCYLLIAVVGLIAVSHRLADLRLPALVDSAQWTRADAALGPWKARRDGTAEAKVFLRFEDGAMRAVAMSAASVDLLGAVADSSELWTTGTEGRVAVGFPGYPLLAVGEVVPA
ncbi:hypothetical protein [Actinokineospora terrae]|uniref:Uncharacterized protein n=1 Tax=Actinokineospora terrae TaxID=155974 RepID=A0A1H9QM08_9PSEU|nr:hypothetical protein [Actinokineospora terrae]SER61611.1 hypothetical protein SAMN04487818_104354 [Actinokineospora terrae]